MNTRKDKRINKTARNDVDITKIPEVVAVPIRTKFGLGSKKFSKHSRFKFACHKLY